MKQLFTLLMVLNYFFTNAQPDTVLKRIEIIESNNYLLDKRFRVLDLPDSINTPVAVELKQFVLENGLLPKENDIEMIWETLRWVSSQWMNDGNNAADKLTPIEILKNAKI